MTTIFISSSTSFWQLLGYDRVCAAHPQNTCQTRHLHLKLQCHSRRYLYFYFGSFSLMMRFVVIGVPTTGVLLDTPSLGGLSTKTKESPLPMRQTSPCRMPTRYFKASGRADRCYTLLKGDLEVAVAKGNLILPRRNSTTGCSLVSCQGQLLLLLLCFFSGFCSGCCNCHHYSC